MLSATTTAEVRARDDHDLGVGVGFLVEDEVWVLAAVLVESPCVEETSRETRALDCLEELLGDDGVSVDVGAVKRRSDTLELGEFGETATAAAGCRSLHSVTLALFREVEDVVEVNVGFGLVKLAGG